MSQGRFDLVIFDCDGVLVDSEEIDDAIIAAVLTEAGVPTTAADLAFTRGTTMANLWSHYEREHGLRTEDLALRHRELSYAAFREHLKPVPGVIETVKAVAASGMKLCVASSGDLDKMEVTLGVTNLARYFDGHIFSASQVSRGKPAPDVFLYAAEQMGAPPGRTAVIEDSLNGIKAGVAAGMTVFAYTPAHGAAEAATLDAIAFSDMRELPGLLGIK